MEIEQTIDGKTVRLFRGGENDSPLVVLLSYQPFGEEVLTLAHQRTSEPVNILEITGMRWHDELSPWPAEPAFRGDLGYRGEGKAFLNMLDKVILPTTLESLSLHPAKTAIMGYSLAGLFALYAGMECDRFDAVISVSGSLWFDGFLDYAKQHRVSHSVQYVYLSLGEKEPFTKNPRMSQVGRCTQELASHLQSLGVACEMRWNSGGHFNDETKRQADGVASYLRHLAQK